MNLLVNGEARSISTARNVSELIDELRLVPATLLVEHNGMALHRSEWRSRSLQDGDRIELVHVVAGG